MTIEQIKNSKNASFSAAAHAIFAFRDARNDRDKQIRLALHTGRGIAEKVTWSRDFEIMDEGSAYVFPDDVAIHMADGERILLGREITISAQVDADTDVTVGKRDLYEIMEEMMDADPSIETDDARKQSLASALVMDPTAVVEFLDLLNYHVWENLDDGEIDLQSAPLG